MSGIAVTLVVAQARNRVIGADGAIPWRLKTDMTYFRTVTMGKPVVMGRKTWDSLKGPLKGRDNIVLTRDANFRADGVWAHASLAAGLACARSRALALLGDRLPAEKAAEWGLIWQCVEDAQLMTEATAIAQRLAKGPQIAYRELKRVLDEAPFNTLDQQLENERRTQRVLGDTEDFREGVISFLTKRDPNFKSK